MVTVAALRTKLQDKVFTPYGKAVTLKTATPSYNDRGEVSSTSYVTSNITIVPYNIVANRQSHENFGSIQEGEMDAAVPYSVTLSVDDIIVIEEENHIVKYIEYNYLPENVVTIIRLAKEQS